MTIDSPVVIDITDISGMIAFRGLTWSYRDVTGPSGGVTLAGYTQLDILARKVDLDVKCRALHLDELQLLLSSIAPETVLVNYNDPLLGNVTKTMHPSGQTATFFNNVAPTGRLADYVWEDITFRLEEL